MTSAIRGRGGHKILGSFVESCELFFKRGVIL